MPGFDGTGPQSQGPLTGGGRGYCAIDISDQVPRGYAGLRGIPARLGARFSGWMGPARRIGRGRGAGRGRGRRSRRW
jgi:hypothetical protein